LKRFERCLTNEYFLDDLNVPVAKKNFDDRKGIFPKQQLVVPFLNN